MDVDFYKSINKNSLLAIGLHKIICDKNGTPRDYEFIEINPMYEQITGMKACDIVGKKITDIFPQIPQNKNDWLETYADVAINEGSKEFKHFFDGIHDYYNLKIYSPKKNYFITMFSDIKTLSPGDETHSMENLFVGDKFDFTEIQSVLDSFYKITNVAMAIGNLEGKLLVKTEFQNICKNFHRKNIHSCDNCTKSDIKLFKSTAAGKYDKYKCLNNMWDISMPINVAGKTIGGLYIGQFFYDDEEVDEEVFRRQAKMYGFDEEEYMKALAKVPRVSHEYIENLSGFFIEFAKVIALLSYKNLDILSANKNQKALILSLEKVEERLNSIVSNIPDAIIVFNPQGKIHYVNSEAVNISGKDSSELIGKGAEEIWRPADVRKFLPIIDTALESNETQSVDLNMKCRDGNIRVYRAAFVPITKEGDVKQVLSIFRDVTKERQREKDLEMMLKNMLTAFVVFESVFDEAGNYISFKFGYFNDEYEKVSGLTQKQVRGKDVFEVWPETEQSWLEAFKSVALTGVSQTFDMYHKPTSGWYHCNVYRPTDSPDRVCVIFEDVTEKRKIDEEKKYQDSLISEMGKAAKIGGWEFDPATGKGTWTEEVAEIHDLNPGDETNVELGLSFYTDESKKIIENAIKEAVENAKPYDLELELVTQKGIRKWVRTIGTPTVENGKVIRVHGAFQDISQRRKNEERIKESEIRHATLLENAPIGIAVHAEGKIVFANPAAFSMFGAKSENDLIGRSIFEIVHPSGHKITEDRIKRVQAGEKGLYPAEDLYVRLDGSTVPVEVMATPIIFKGKPAVQVIVTDITERKKAEENLRYLSYHDQLTGIYNRRFFEEALIKADSKKNLPLTIVMADVNGLKLINDSFGHSYGDELLIKASNAIEKELRDGDLLARLGGDEFVMLLPKTTSEEAESLIRRVQIALKNEKVKSVALSVSFGYQTKTRKSEKIQDVLANAENHMYKHKIYESSSMHSKSVEIVMNTLYEKSERELMHSLRVSKYCEDIATALNMSQDAVNQIKTAGMVHDIGKIGVDENILNKADKLNDDEWEEMKKHPERGWRILITSNEFSELADFVLEHQERWDGKGYPNGLKGDKISIEARIIALADAYDAMTSKRSYRKAMSKEEAVKEIEKYAGKQFDSDIVNVFIEKVLNKA